MFINAKDAAKLMGLTVRTIREKCYQGKIPYYRSDPENPKSTLLFDPKELCDYIRTSRVPTIAEQADGIERSMNLRVVRRGGV